ncbi:hypothetical protein AMTRI_Chr06g178610 [Amborella trichopoda]
MLRWELIIPTDLLTKRKNALLWEWGQGMLNFSLLPLLFSLKVLNMVALPITTPASLGRCHLIFTTSLTGRTSGFHSYRSKLGPMCSMKSSHMSKRETSSKVEHHGKSIEELREEARRMLMAENGGERILNLMDLLQHLGLAHNFEREIEHALDLIYQRNDGYNDLSSVSLRFRLLRQVGYNVSSDNFKKFTLKEGKFNPCLIEDVRGMLCLYEASHLGTPREDILNEALNFTSKHLKGVMEDLEPNLAREIRSALELPLHRRVNRLMDNNKVLLELAKLDFNMVQLLYQREINDILRWWRELGLTKQLTFARDRPLECYFWMVGIFSEPSFSKFIDDIYDIYGSLEELEIFTNAIQRWDLSAMEELPEYMKICYLALYNTINQMAIEILNDYGRNVVMHLKKRWSDLCHAYLVEAQWVRRGYVPTLDEYLRTSAITGGTYMALFHSLCLMGDKVTRESNETIDQNPNIVWCSAVILRLWDDLGTSKDEKERGDVSSSIEYYMRNNGKCTDDQARENIRSCISDTWKELNCHYFQSSPFSKSFSKAALNLSRMAQVIYQHGDNPSFPAIDDHIKSFMDPIPLLNQQGVEFLCRSRSGCYKI